MLAGARGRIKPAKILAVQFAARISAAIVRDPLEQQPFWKNPNIKNGRKAGSTRGLERPRFWADSAAKTRSFRRGDLRGSFQPTR